jgi:hypothetical protein
MFERSFVIAVIEGPNTAGRDELARLSKALVGTRTNRG